MTITRTLVALLAALSIAASSFAQSAPAAPAPQRVTPPPGKALIYGGAATFAGGMATALYGFIRAGNGEFARFGEATSRNKQLGAAGIAAAFAGGTMMFLGSRMGRYAPSAVTVSRSGLAVEKQLTW
jgi:hypothetical protein